MLIVVSAWLKRMLPDVQQQMWQMYRSTGDLGAAAAAIGVDRLTVRNWIHEQGGLRPRRAAPAAPRVGVVGRLKFEDRVHPLDLPAAVPSHHRASPGQVPQLTDRCRR